MQSQLNYSAGMNGIGQGFQKLSFLDSSQNNTVNKLDMNTKQIEDLHNIIRIKALSVAKKRTIEDLTLMDLLNGFDIVIAEKKPRTDIANHVYRLILRQEREKQQSSIQDLSMEIQNLQKVDNSSNSKQQIHVQTNNSSHSKQFDFQGSFGEDDRNMLFNQQLILLFEKSIYSGEKESIINFKMRQKLTLPKISLDSVLELQKNESFQNRCQKLSILEKSSGNKFSSNNPTIIKSSFKQSLNNHELSNILDRSVTPNFLNKDIDFMISNRSPAKNPFQRDTKLQLPKLNFSGLLNKSPGSSGNKRSQSMSYTKDKAIDSDRAIAFAYYTRKLLVNGWRAFYNYRLEKANQAIMDQIAQQRFAKNAKKKVFKAIHRQAKQHYGHGPDNKRARAMISFKLGQKYLQLWRDNLKQTLIEKKKLQKAKQVIDRLKKKQVFKQLKSIVVRLQMGSVQNKTSKHIFRQRYLRKSMIALRYFVKHRRELRHHLFISKQHSFNRMKQQGISAFQINRIESSKFREMRMIADDVRQFNLKKQALFQYKQFMLGRLQYLRLNDCAENYYRLGLIKTAIDQMKKYTLVAQGENQQRYFIDTFYQKKIKSNLFQFLLASNYIISEQEENIIVLKDRQRLRKYFQAIVQNKKLNRLVRVPKQPSFYYFAQVLLHNSFGKLLDEPQDPTIVGYNDFMRKSKVQYYKGISQQALKKLKAYYMIKIFEEWKNESRQLTRIKKTREQKIKFQIMKHLRIKSGKNSKYRYLLQKIVGIKQNELKMKIIKSLLTNQRQRKLQTQIISRLSLHKLNKKLQKTFLALKIFAKRQQFRKNQKLAAIEIHTNKLLEQPYLKWRKLYLDITKRRELKQIEEKHLRKTLLKKYLYKMLNEFSKNSTYSINFNNLMKLKKKKLIKKVLCGFLQNILVKTHKNNQLKKALGYRKHNLLIKSVKVWQYMLPELKQKNSLFKMMRSDQYQKITAKIFNALKLYHNFRLNKLTVDHLMMKNIQLITIKRFMKQWQSSLNKKIGLRMLAHTFDKHSKQEFFNRVHKKGKYEDTVTTHMNFYRVFKLLELTLIKGFKKNVDNRYRWFENIQQSHERSLYYQKKQFLRMWNEQFKKNQKEYKTAHFAIIQIKNQIIKKYFKVLKKKHIRNKIERDQLRKKNSKIKQKFFLGLKKIVKSRINCKKQHQYLTKYKRKQNIRNIFGLWINELSELQVIRNFRIEKQSQQAYHILHRWREIIKKRAQYSQVLMGANEIIDKLIVKQYFRYLSEQTKFKKDSRKKKQIIVEQQKLKVKSQVLLAFNQYISQNYEAIQKTLFIRKKMQRRIKFTCFDKMLEIFEPQLVRMRVMKRLLQISQNGLLRQNLSQWIDYTQQSQIIESIGERQYQIKTMIQKQQAIRQLQQFKQRSVIQRDRVRTINDYWVKKTQLKFLTMMRYSIRLIQYRRDNQRKAQMFLIDKLQRKALLSLAYQTQKNELFRQLTNQLHYNLKIMNAPKFLQKLRQHTYKQKENKIKDQFAFSFMSQRLQSVAFKSLIWNVIVHRERKNINNRAIIFKCEKLIRDGYNAIKIYSFSQQIKAKKRMLMSNTIMKLDQSMATRLAFDSLKFNKDIEKDKRLQFRGQIVLNQMRRIFESWNLIRQQKNRVKNIGRQVYQKHRTVELQKLMIIWMRALNNEAKVKVMQRNTQDRLKNQVLNVLQRKYSLKQFQRIKLTNKAYLYLQLALNSLKNYTLRQKRIRIVEQDLITKYKENQLSRSFMGFRYQTLIMKNQRVLQQKQARFLAIKSFNGWKYTIILEKTQRDYQTIKYKESLSQTFCKWFNLYKYQSTQRNMIAKIAIKKHQNNLVNYFKKWQKQAYHGKFIDLLQVNYTFPHQRYVAQRCIDNWRRYAQLQRNRGEIVEQVQDIQASLIARSSLRKWYQATQPKLAARIFAQRLTRSVNKLLKIKALYLISEQGQRNEYLTENLEDIEQRRNYEAIRMHFNEWRKQFAACQLQKVIEIKNARNTMKQCLIALCLNAQNSQEEKTYQNQIQEYVSQTSIQTQNNLIKTFSSYTLINNKESLLKKYFLRMRQGCENLKKLNDLKYKSIQYFRYKSYVKYFYHMVQTFYMANEDREHERKGYQVWNIKTKKRVINALIVNIFKQRKYKNAEMYYNCKISTKAINLLRHNLQMTKKKSQLNTIMMYTLKKKCIQLFKISFTQWRIKYEHRKFGKQAVCEYSSFRNMKLKRMAFDYFNAIIQQKLQIKDMVNKAQRYFEKKGYLKMAHQVFYALRDYAAVKGNKKAQYQDRELMALKFYAYNLMVGHLKAWKKEVRMNRNRQKRSKMYAVYSAWKFYTKERSLLKKYLLECNGGMMLQSQNVDPNMMSTQEMRENVARFSNLQSNFGESVSSGAHYNTNSQERKVLGTNANVLNFASPQISNVNNSVFNSSKTQTRQTHSTAGNNSRRRY